MQPASLTFRCRSWPLIAQAGQQRVRVDRGWISVYTRDGTQLLDRVVRCPRQRSQPAATSCEQLPLSTIPGYCLTSLRRSRSLHTSQRLSQRCRPTRMAFGDAWPAPDVAFSAMLFWLSIRALCGGRCGLSTPRPSQSVPVPVFLHLRPSLASCPRNAGRPRTTSALSRPPRSPPSAAS